MKRTAIIVTLALMGLMAVLFSQKHRVEVAQSGGYGNQYRKGSEMKVKEGVKLHGLNQKMRIVLIEANKVWRDHGQELCITSTTDGVHSPGSWHPFGFAVDFRTRYFNKQEVNSVATDLRGRLSSEYDVVVEPTHIHVEYDQDKVVAL